MIPGMTRAARPAYPAGMVSADPTSIADKTFPLRGRFGHAFLDERLLALGWRIELP